MAMETGFAKSSVGESTSFQSLTCITCRMSFITPKDQREHYKSDMHRFNLKRKVAELPPVTLEVFQQKVTTSTTEANAAQSKATPVADHKCAVCRKYYSSPNALATHMRSNKHLEAVKNSENIKVSTPTQPMDAESSTQSASQPSESSPSETTSEPSSDTPMSIPLSEMTEEQLAEHMLKNARHLTSEECMFCLKKSSSLESNVKHMATEHGFFIPDIEYLTDLEGLIKYLSEMISVGFMCLHCGEKKSFWSMEAVQSHMRDLAHCKLDYEDNEAEFEDFYDFSRDYPTEGTDADKQIQLRESTTPVRVNSTGSELILSDGKSVGHRSLAIYYKQRYRKRDNRESRTAIEAMISEYKLLGWDGKRGTSTMNQKPKDVYRRERVMNLSLGQKGNNQKYYLDQTKLL